VLLGEVGMKKRNLKRKKQKDKKKRETLKKREANKKKGSTERVVFLSCSVMVEEV
jgi:hypothetical protein